MEEVTTHKNYYTGEMPDMRTGIDQGFSWLQAMIFALAGVEHWMLQEQPRHDRRFHQAQAHVASFWAERDLYCVSVLTRVSLSAFEEK